MVGAALFISVGLTFSSVKRVHVVTDDSDEVGRCSYN